MSRVSGGKQDETEFLAIAKGLIRKDLASYLLKTRFMVGRDGKALVAIPISQIDIPTFRYGFPDDVVIGQGEGKPGDDLGAVEPDDDGTGGKGAGGGPGSKIIVEVDEEEFFDWFGEYLHLPRIKPKGERTIFEEREKFSSIHRLGPKSAMHLRRSFREALKREVATNRYLPPEKMDVTIMPPDMRFKSSRRVREPRNSAVLGFMRDISGSVSAEEAEALSILCDYCERWLRVSYQQGAFEVFYIVHDGEAQEVNRRQFLATESWGGTIASTAHELAARIIDERYPPASWNIYLFYFSDGFNFGSDNWKYMEILRNQLLPVVNQYNYGQTDIERPWLPAYRESGATTFSLPGTLGHILQRNFSHAENLATAAITGRDKKSVIEAIKRFFGKETA